MKNWKNIFFIIPLIACHAFAHPQFIDKIAAIVNDDIILNSDISSLACLDRRLNTSQKSQNNSKEAVDRSQYLDRLINDQIILKMADQVGLNVSNKLINQVTNDILHTNHISTNQLSTNLNCSNTNNTTFRKQILKGILVSEFSFSEVKPQIVIPLQEVKQVAKKNETGFTIKLSSIFFPITKDMTFSQIRRVNNEANDIAKQSYRVNNFSKDSIISKTLRKSGWVTWKNVKAMPDIFTVALRTAKEGDILGPIHTKKGLYILKVTNLGIQQHIISCIQFYVRLISFEPSIMSKGIYLGSDLIALNTTLDFQKKLKKIATDDDQIGEVKWSLPSDYPKKIRNNLVNLSKGQVSLPIFSRVGWQFIEVLDIRHVNKTISTLKEQAYRVCLKRKFSTVFQNWMYKNRDHAYINIGNKNNDI